MERVAEYSLGKEVHCVHYLTLEILVSAPYSGASIGEFIFIFLFHTAVYTSSFFPILCYFAHDSKVTKARMEIKTNLSSNVVLI